MRPIGQRTRARPNTRRATAAKAITLQRFIRRAKGNFWDHGENRRKYLDFVKNQFGNTYEALYSLTTKDIHNTGGSGILDRYGQSHLIMVMSEYPEYAWKPWRFSSSPKGWWTDLAVNFITARTEEATAVVREYLQDLAVHYNIQSLNDWDYILLTNKLASIAPLSERMRIQTLGGLPFVLYRLFPYYPWSIKEPTRIMKYTQHMLPRNYWKDEQNQRIYFNFLKEQLGGTYECLYHVESRHVAQSGGLRGVNLDADNNSIPALIMRLYPEHHWAPWMFRKTPRNWWSEFAARFKENDPVVIELLRDYIEHLASRYNITNLKGWYDVGAVQLGWTYDKLQLLGGLTKVLITVFPHHPWDLRKLGYQKRIANKNTRHTKQQIALAQIQTHVLHSLHTKPIIKNQKSVEMFNSE